MSLISSPDTLQLFDAHCHAADPRLVSEEIVPVLPGNLRAQVVNGTHPDDWSVIERFNGLGEVHPLKAYGVHPWKVHELPGDWIEQLRMYLSTGAVSIGEIGLDNWVEPLDATLQLEVFRTQLELACEFDLPPSIHCVRAWGGLLDALQSSPRLRRGFLLHGYSGSTEMLHQFLDLGGYVSFSAYGAHPARKRIRDAVRACPGDRLLVETDSPDMLPPAEVCQYETKDKQGNRLHHPAEIVTAYACLADWRGDDQVAFAAQVAENFHRLFGE